MDLLEFAITASEALMIDYNMLTSIKKVTKNNGTERIGLEYLSDNDRIHPVLYMETYYDEFLKTGDMNTEIMYECLKIHSGESQQFTIDDFSDWEYVKDRIIFRLINRERNKEFLESHPHVEFGKEFAVIFAYVFDDLGASVTVTDALADTWNKDADELFAAASENTPRIFQSELIDMDKMLSIMLDNREEFPNPIPMYVLSNRQRLHGASTILYFDFSSVFDTESQLYLIPSSVHEWIVIPNAGGDPNTICDMIKEVNRTVVAPEEVLSDNLYIYNFETCSIEIVK